MSEDKDKIIDLLACLSVQTSVIREATEDILTSVSNLAQIIKDSPSSPDKNKRLKLWLDMTKEKMIGFTYSIPYELHENFKKKCREEGYSIQEGIARLIKSFVDETFIIKK